MIVDSGLIFKSIALRTAKTQSFGRSECNRVKEQSAVPQRGTIVKWLELLCYGADEGLRD